MVTHAISPMYSTRTALFLGCLAYGASASSLRRSNDGSLEVEPTLWGAANSLMADLKPVTRSASDPRVVISLTTVPGGVSSLGVVISSLKNQTVAADAIEINLPGESNRKLGEYNIEKFQELDMDRVKVYRTDDWFALTSLVPTVRRALLAKNNTLVIVVDDDKVYPPTLVEDHLRAHRARPKSAHTCRGYKLPPGEDIYQGHYFSRWNERVHSVYGDAIGSPERVAVVTGSDSWSVPSEVFTPKLWDDLRANGKPTEIAEAAEKFNDIYASGQLSRLRVAKYVMPCRRQCKDAPKTRERASQELSYWPWSRDKNTEQVMQFFANSWDKDEIMSANEMKSFEEAKKPSSLWSQVKSLR